LIESFSILVSSALNTQKFGPYTVLELQFRVHVYKFGVPGSCIWWGSLKFWSCQEIPVLLQDQQCQFEQTNIGVREKELLFIHPSHLISSISYFKE